jgi:hypothetical protein
MKKFYGHGDEMNARHTIIGTLMKLESEGRYQEAALLRKKLGGKWVLTRRQRLFLFIGRIAGFNR